MLERSPTRISREHFSLIFSLTNNQPWLKDRQVELVDLVDECQSDDQQILLCDLLQRMMYLDADGFRNSIQEIASYIEVTLGLGPEDTKIVAGDNSGYSDSSHFVLYSLKNAVWKSEGWLTTSFVSNYEKVLSSNISNIILVDEFVGTGDSAIKVIEKIKNIVDAEGKQVAIYFATVAAMRSGLDRVKGAVEGVYASHILHRGITDSYPEVEVPAKIELMKSMEGRLATKAKRGKISRHSLGYKQSEALYARSGGNTPNNVFPVFWWEKNFDEIRRRTLLRNL